MVDVVTNYSTSILSALVFQPGSLGVLKSVGLLGVYLDDYGSRKKYTNCLFFHFKFGITSINLQNTGFFPAGIKSFGVLSNVTNFKSFYDFYETSEGIMLIFRFNPVFINDIKHFKQGEFSKFSPYFKDAVQYFSTQNVQIDISNEIYRYSETSKIK
jgi:hypothetical protein